MPTRTGSWVSIHRIGVPLECPHAIPLRVERNPIPTPTLSWRLGAAVFSKRNMEVVSPAITVASDLTAFELMTGGET
jgi:hypothetical protein